MNSISNSSTTMTNARGYTFGMTIEYDEHNVGGNLYG